MSMAIPETGQTQPDVFQKIAKASNFHQRLQLFTYMSGLAKGANKKIEPGNFGVVETSDSLTHDLGREFQVALFAWRPKAVDLSDTEDITSTYVHGDALWESIQGNADKGEEGFMYGVEYLTWIPEVDMFVTNFLGSKTGRRSAKAFDAIYNAQTAAATALPCTLRSLEIKKGKHEWHGQEIVQFSGDFRAPEPDQLEAAFKIWKKEMDPSENDATTEGAEPVDHDR